MMSRGKMGHVIHHCLVLSFIIGLSCLSTNNAFSILSSTSRSSTSIYMSMNYKSKGCAAIPYNKKKVAVFGTGGYMGATIFGFIQRASAIYGTGLGSPRAIVATPIGSESLNRVLGRTFKLAFAGEDMVRLTDMTDTDAIAASLKGMDAAVLGTVYQLERKSVALNSYEKTPNDKTFEFYLDDKYAVDSDISPDDIGYHLEMFKKSVDACVSSGLEHIVVIETPNTKDAKPFAAILNGAGIPFTYLHVNGNVENTKLYTFEEGVQSNLSIDVIETKDCIDTMCKSDQRGTIAREDVATVAVQSLLSLDWSSCKCLNVVSSGVSLEKKSAKERSKLKSDRDWCINSHVVADAIMRQK